jgi:hypothetical protein
MHFGFPLPAVFQGRYDSNATPIALQLRVLLPS